MNLEGGAGRGDAYVESKREMWKKEANTYGSDRVREANAQPLPGKVDGKIESLRGQVKAEQEAARANQDAVHLVAEQDDETAEDQIEQAREEVAAS